MVYRKPMSLRTMSGDARLIREYLCWRLKQTIDGGAQQQEIALVLQALGDGKTKKTSVNEIYKRKPSAGAALWPVLGDFFELTLQGALAKAKEWSRTQVGRDWLLSAEHIGDDLVRLVRGEHVDVLGQAIADFKSTASPAQQARADVSNVDATRASLRRRAISPRSK